jgi:hypothetical protein
MRELLILNLDQAPSDSCQRCWFASQCDRLRTVAIDWDRIRLVDRSS